jgi:hypothetical protein
MTEENELKEKDGCKPSDLSELLCCPFCGNKNIERIRATSFVANSIRMIGIIEQHNALANPLGQ